LADRGSSAPETSSPAAAVGAVSNPAIVAAVRRLRVLSAVLQGWVLAIVAGSVLALGSVHAWAYVPLWCACAVAALLSGAEALMIHRLRRTLGPHRFALHPAKRWLTLGGEAPPGEGWEVDLAAPAVARTSLLLPALLFLAWAALGLLRTVSTADTLRGLAFVGSALLLHQAAAQAYRRREAQRLLLRGLAALGVLLSLIALVQMGLGLRRIYGLVAPVEVQTFFGPFVNRNHFGGYMLLLVPLCLGRLNQAWLGYTWRAGHGVNLRRRLVAISSPEGTALIYASVAVVATAGALAATTSRGALFSFLFGLAVTAAALLRKRASVRGWVAGLAAMALVLAWTGLPRIGQRVAQVLGDAPGRTTVWRDALGRMQGHWWTGYGFNTFAQAMSRSRPWQLPAGSTPWPSALQAAVEAGEAPGFRQPASLEGLLWYREAHNDFLQLLVETGLPGLALALWGTIAVLRSARDPWLRGALAGVLFHCLVDFDMQIPALAALFVVLAALGGGGERSS
jgi:O-antigen ligase